MLGAQNPVACEDAWEAGTFAGCGCSEELISVGLGMMSRWLRAAAARVMRARRGPRRRARAGWRRGPSLGRLDRPTPFFKCQHDAAIAEFERALALNPNFIDNRFAFALSCAGKHERAIEVLEANIRLDPFQPVIFSLGAMGMANYMLKRYDALRLLRECASRLPNLQACHVFLASAYSQSGQLEEARAEAADLRKRVSRLRRSCGSTRISLLKDGSALPPTRTPRMPSIELMGCAGPGYRRIEHWPTWRQSVIRV
jgi:tetratricopeptide (TPR) repeat protein